METPMNVKIIALYEGIETFNAFVKGKNIAKIEFTPGSGRYALVYWYP